MSVAHILTDTVSYATIASRDSSGDPTYDSAATTSARWEETTKQIRTPTGDFVQSDHWMICETDIPKNARVWAPGVSTSSLDSSHEILSKKKAATPNGALTLYEYRL